VSDEDEGWTFQVRETSAGAYLVTGVDRRGPSVTLRGEDPDVLIDEARTWWRAHKSLDQ
jgi:hypothetical protein